MPAIMLKSSLPRCMEVPLPADGKLSAPGSFFASAINSFVLLAGKDGCTARIKGDAVTIEIGAKSRCGSQLILEYRLVLVARKNVPISSVYPSAGARGAGSGVGRAGGR